MSNLHLSYIYACLCCSLGLKSIVWRIYSHQFLYTYSFNATNLVPSGWHTSGWAQHTTLEQGLCLRYMRVHWKVLLGILLIMKHWFEGLKTHVISSFLPHQMKSDDCQRFLNNTTFWRTWMIICESAKIIKWRLILMRFR